jgi:hypothetical protein
MFEEEYQAVAVNKLILSNYIKYNMLRTSLKTPVAFSDRQMFTIKAAL